MLWEHQYIPVSLSSTYYNSNEKPWFTIAIILTTAFMIVPLLEITPEDDQWLVFLSCIGNLFCAFAPKFREELEGKVHYIGAYTAGILSQLWCCLYNSYTLWIWGIFCILIMFLYLYEWANDKDSTVAFWAELLCFMNIYLTYSLL